MRPLVFWVCMAGIVLGVGSVGVPQTLKRQMTQQDLNGRLAEEVKNTNKICGTQINATIAWDKLPDASFGQAGAVLGICDKALSALEAKCRASSAGAVARSVKAVSCVPAAKRALALSGGTLVFHIDPGAGDNFNYVHAYLDGAF